MLFLLLVQLKKFKTTKNKDNTEKVNKILCGVNRLQGARTLSREATVHIKVY